MFLVTHKSCGKPAFYAPFKPEFGMVMSSTGVVMPDGTKPESRTEVVCGSCGETMTAADVTISEIDDADVPTA